MTQISDGVQKRMLRRSFAVQGSWNYETLIGAGFCYTILPALREVYGDDTPELHAAAARHAQLFNSHPYFATVAVGAVARLEADGADPPTIERFKLALRGSLGSLGDRLVWSTWRPMSMLIALALLLAGAAWWVAAAVFLGIYNGLHLWIRRATLKLGVDSGLDVGKRLRELPLQLLIEKSSQLACFMVGVTVVLAAAPAAVDWRAMLATLVSVALGFLLGLQMRKAMIALLAVVIATSLIMGLFGYGA